MPAGFGSSQLGQIVNGVLPILGGAFGNRSQTSTTTPILTPQQTSIFGPLSSAYLKYLNNATDLSGYQAGQAQTIANNSDILKNQSIENLAARGITTGAAPATAATAVDSSRISQLNQLSQQIPLLQNELTQQALTTGTNLFHTLPSGSATTKPGNILGGIFGNASASGITGILQALSQIIPGLGNIFNGNSSGSSNGGIDINTLLSLDPTGLGGINGLFGGNGDLFSTPQFG